jgi:Rps23 Pro-64 3,4-dihydroxylase Tpa1-like proline 4-hydroxylase
MHEVLPIYCASRAFADSRFTINGWIRRWGVIPNFVSKVF